MLILNLIESERTNLCLSMITKHPFVKAKTKVTVERELHTFEVQGFATDPWKLRKWLKSKEGKQFSSVAGGVSDDALYVVFEREARELKSCLSLLTALCCHEYFNKNLLYLL